MHSSERVQVQLSNGVTTLTLNRPEGLNSFNTAMKKELLDALRASLEDGSRALILTGAGRGFCVGQDLRDHAQQLDSGSRAPFEAIRDYYNPMAESLSAMNKPTIAAINGAAAGAGLSLAMLNDFRIAADTATFTTAFAGIGLSCDTGASWTLQRLVGYRTAKQLLFDPTPISAERALDLGLVDAVVPASELMAVATERARQLAQGPTLAYCSLRGALDYASTHSLTESLAFEEPLMMAAGDSADHRGAVAAFLNKEKPTFSGQ